MAGSGPSWPCAAEEDGDQGLRGIPSCDSANIQVIGLTILGSVLGIGTEFVNQFFERAEWMVSGDSWGNLVA